VKGRQLVSVVLVLAVVLALAGVASIPSLRAASPPRSGADLAAEDPTGRCSTVQEYIRTPEHRATRQKTYLSGPPAASAPRSAQLWLDEFNSPTLDPRWSWVREDPTHWSLAAHPGYLRITTQAGGLVGPRNDQRNLLLAAAPSGDYHITTRMTIAPGENFQYAAIQVYEDDDNYVQLNRAFANGDTVNFDHEAGGVVTGIQRVEAATTLYLRIARRGTTYSGYYSTDGQTWVTVGHHTAALSSPRIGLGAANNLSAVTEIPADFDFFEVKSIDTHVFLPAVMRGYGPPDIVYVNGVVLTMDEDLPQAEAIAIAGDSIVAVGNAAEILALPGPQTQVVDLGGRTLMPGFVDPHTHLLNSAGATGLAAAQQAALQHGITTLAEAYCDASFLALMRSLEQAGELRVRTSLYLAHVDACGVLQGDWYKQHPPTRQWGEMLRIGGVKVFTDGGSCGAPAYSYDHPVHGYGDLWFTQEELNAMIAGIQAAGYQAAIHALGDRAVDQVLHALEFALDGGPNTPRHRIEHNAVVRDDMLARYTAADAVPLIFGAYPACLPSVAPPPLAYQGWEWRWPDLLAANPGLHFAWHSDRGGPLFPLPPLMHLYSMVTPFEVDADGQTICDTPDWLAHKMLTVEQALPMMSIEAAYALFRDEEVGSLRKGKLADLIVLSGNPLAVDPDAIKDIEVWVTMVGGRVEYCAPGQEALCPRGVSR
jgi:predicted amidohydrolase YtcJ